MKSILGLSVRYDLRGTEETEDEEELVCCGTEGVGCVRRARDERRGDMVAVSVIKAVSAW